MKFSVGTSSLHVTSQPHNCSTHQIAHTLRDDVPACQASVHDIREVEHEKVVEKNRVTLWLNGLVGSLGCRWRREDKVHEVLDNAVVKGVEEGDNPDPVPIQVTQVLRNQADAQGTLGAKLYIPTTGEEEAESQRCVRESLFTLLIFWMLHTSIEQKVVHKAKGW